MVDQSGKSRDLVKKKSKRLIALKGNSNSPFSVASDLVSSPTLSFQEKPASADEAPYDSLGSTTTAPSGGQGRTSLGKAVGLSAGEHESRRDPVPLGDGALLAHSSDFREGGETASDGSRSEEVAEAVTFAAVYNGSLGLLASREHSAGELREKLKQKYPDGEIYLDAVLERLKEVGLQNDERFAEMFVRYKANRGQGPAKIGHQLRSKSVDGAVISAALSDPRYDWSELAKAVSQKKFGASGGERLSPKERARRQRFLQGRGFGYEHIASAL